MQLADGGYISHPHFSSLWTHRRRAAWSCLSPGGIGGREEVSNSAVHLWWACCPGNCLRVCVCVCGGGGGGGSSWVRIIRNVLPIYLIPIYSWYLPLLPCVLCSAQLVTREFSRHLPRIQAWVRHGFAVVMVDNRGSANRGTKFEAHIQACCVYITKYPRVHAATIFVWY